MKLESYKGPLNPSDVPLNLSNGTAYRIRVGNLGEPIEDYGNHVFVLLTPDQLQKLEDLLVE